MPKFESDQSVFNFAIEYLKDISNSLKMCKIFAIQHNAHGWTNQLRVVYRELSVKTNPNEDEEFEKDFLKVYMLLNDRENEKDNHNKLMFHLDQLEIKLRKKLQLKGMLLPGKADPRFAILER